MFVKAAKMAGCVLGWTTALGVALSGALPFEQQNAVMLLALSVALLSSACMALEKHQRPLGAAFELGYDEGRRDAIRELTKRSNVSQIRPRAIARSESENGIGYLALLDL